MFCDLVDWWKKLKFYFVQSAIIRNFSNYAYTGHWPILVRVLFLHTVNVLYRKNKTVQTTLTLSPKTFKNATVHNVITRPAVSTIFKKIFINAFVITLRVDLYALFEQSFCARCHLPPTVVTHSGRGIIWGGAD